ASWRLATTGTGSWRFSPTTGLTATTSRTRTGNCRTPSSWPPPRRPSTRPTPPRCAYWPNGGETRDDRAGARAATSAPADATVPGRARPAVRPAVGRGRGRPRAVAVARAGRAAGLLPARAGRVVRDPVRGHP